MSGFERQYSASDSRVPDKSGTLFEKRQGEINSLVVKQDDQGKRYSLILRKEILSDWLISANIGLS